MTFCTEEYTVYNCPAIFQEIIFFYLLWGLQIHQHQGNHDHQEHPVQGRISGSSLVSLIYALLYRVFAVCINNLNKEIVGKLAGDLLFSFSLYRIRTNKALSTSFISKSRTRETVMEIWKHILEQTGEKTMRQVVYGIHTRSPGTPRAPAGPGSPRAPLLPSSPGGPEGP